MGRIKKEENIFEERFLKICQNSNIDKKIIKNILIKNKNITKKENIESKKKYKKPSRPYAMFISDIYKIINNNYDNITECFPKQYIEIVTKRIPINTKIDKRKSTEISKIWNEISKESYLKKYEDEKRIYNLNLEIEKLTF